MTQADLYELDNALTFLMIAVPLAFLIPMIGGWIAEYRERRRVKRIMEGGDDEG